METPERPDRSLPSPWTPPAAAAVPAAAPAPYARPPAWEELPDPEAPASSRRLTPRLVLRALRRRWWQALLLWATVSAGAMALVYRQVKPAYDATAWLKVEPAKSPLGTQDDLGGVFMDTQVQLIVSPDVLNMVVQDPKCVGQPSLRTIDPETTLRSKLRVMIPPKTNLILISMSSPQPSEAATIVNAVADAYLRSSSTWLDATTREQMAQLRQYKERFANEMQRLRDDLTRLSDKGIQADPRDSTQEALNTYRMYRGRADQIELEIMDAEATVQALRALRRQSGAPEVAASPLAPADGLTDAQLDQLVQQAYLADAQVAALHRDMAAAKELYQAAGRTAARGHDPAVAKFERDYERLRQQNERLWREMRPRLREQIAAMPPRDPDPIAQEIREAAVRLEKLRTEKAEVEEALAGIKRIQIAEGNDLVGARFTSEDLAYATEMYKKMSLALESLEYEANGPAKVTLVARGEASAQPTSDRRPMLMAAAPVGVLALIAAAFTLLELGGARVADPDELASRLRLGVIGVVPPLPSLLPPKGPKALRDQRRKLEEFVQSLDHLRVTLCAAAGAAGGRRCVLITSAVGGEGKTTLAAQLAGRCANAGLSTLLVDADLRRPSLGELLEVPEGPGLAEVLLGEVAPEGAMVVIGNAGGFHLLPAGGGGHDPSRLLQGERLGQLVARLREAFDVVLIDAPPVLPVPDALLIGRWTDGAVVAVRHDSSRFPLVERAQKRLTAIGVPLLGAVVNGVRPAESSYGAYDYYATIGGRAGS